MSIEQMREPERLYVLVWHDKIGLVVGLHASERDALDSAAALATGAPTPEIMFPNSEALNDWIEEHGIIGGIYPRVNPARAQSDSKHD